MQRTLGALLCTGALATGDVAAAEKGVTLYRDPGFEGASQTYTLDVPELGLGDESVSSLRVAAGCQVTLYRDSEFQGTAFTTTSDLSDLAQTPIGDDSLSSLKIDCDVRRPSERPAERSDREARAARPLRPPRPERGEGVRVFEHRDFQGDSELFTGPDDDLGDNVIHDDSASSVQVAKGCQVSLYPDRQYGGASITIKRDTADLGSTALGEDELSSLQVVCRRSRRPSTKAPLLPGDGVELYANQHFLGRYERLTADDANLSDNPTGDDNVSSVRVASGCRAVLYREPDFQGASYAAVADIPDLARTPIGDDALSSIEVTCRSRD